MRINARNRIKGAAPLLIALVLLGTVPAWAAEEPSGCDKFKWNIERERAALTAPDRVALTSAPTSLPYRRPG